MAHDHAKAGRLFVRILWCCAWHRSIPLIIRPSTTSAIPNSRRKARLGGRSTQRASPPRRLGEWLLQNDPSEIRAIASFIGYPRQHIIPVLASALLAHFVATVPSGQRLVGALFSSKAQSQALVGQVARALKTGGKFENEGKPMPCRRSPPRSVP